MWIIFAVLLLSLISFEASEPIEPTPTNASQCQPTSPEYLNIDRQMIYSGFTHLSQLNFFCDAEVYHEHLQGTPEVTLHFDTAETPDEPIEIHAFLISKVIRIQIFGVRRFEISRTLFNVRSNTLDLNNYVIYAADWQFYYNGLRLNEDSCDADVLEDAFINFLSNLRTTILIFEFENDRTSPICPYVFKNAYINHIHFFSFDGSRIGGKNLRFVPVKNPSNRTIDLNCVFGVIDIDKLYMAVIDEEMLNPLVFGKHHTLSLRGKIAAITPDFFKSLPHTRFLFIHSTSIRELVHFSTNDWLTHIFDVGFKSEVWAETLAYYVTYKKLGFTLILSEQFYGYDYPDEDFCLFKHFPASRAIATLIVYEDAEMFARMNSSKRSRTISFLMQHSNELLKYTSASTFYSLTNSISFDDSQVNESEFKLLVYACFNQSLFVSSDSKRLVYLTYYDVVYGLEWLELIGPVVSFPLVSALAFVLNMIVILVIRSKRNREEKLFESKIFAYVQLNSAFNCAECFVYQFRLMGICIKGNSVFCSSIRRVKFVQYFLASVTGYLSETLKTCSMLTGLVFSLVRYVETSKTKSRWLKILADGKTKKIFGLIVATSLVISVPKTFEYDFKVLYHDSPEPFYIQILVSSFIKTKTVFYFAHYLVTDMLILVLNLVVDLKLVAVIKRNLAQKLAMAENSSDLVRMSIEAKKKRSVENKSNAMIISSVFLYIFCRLPELLGRIYSFVGYTGSLNDSCTGSVICYLVLNTIEYLYMLSYNFTILLYYKFNNNFKKGLTNLFKTGKK